MARGFVIGLLTAVAVIAIAGYAVLVSGLVYGGQDFKPGGIEKWGARQMQRATMRRGMAGLTSPLQPSEDNLLAGVELYDTHCRVCHGGSDGVSTAIAKGLTPQAPQLAKDGVEDDPVEMSYWKVAHGIRFTGMPAFHATLSDQQMWQIALFVRHMNALPPRAQRAWGMQTASP
jgi:thiosulfate dehydrogenase